MHRPTQRRDALRERVVAGRQQRAVRLRRAAAARKGGRRMVALFAGLAMVAGVLTVTQLASSALEDRNSGLGACETTAPAEEEEAGIGEAAEEGEAAPAPDEVEEVVPPENPVEDPAADGVTSTDELEAHVVVESDGFRHTHYRRPGWRPGRGHGHGHHRPRPRPTTPPAEETTPPVDCEEPTEDPTSDPTSDPTGDPTSDPTAGPTGEPTSDPTAGPTEDPTGEPTEEPTEEPSPTPTDPTENPDLFVGNTCDAIGGGLANHTGFQSNDAQCVIAQHGAVAQVQNSPSLIIADAPQAVGVNEPFSIFVSTRNLVRDFFPAAGQGGYYLNSAFLNEEGLQRGHFHTGCVLLSDPSVPPTPDELLNPQFFAATEDGGGEAAPDTVEVIVANGLPTPGLYRCASWAGDASHRTPMMNFARQQPAMDAVRIEVTG